MKKKIIWRLKEQPSAETLRELVKDQILTKEEAREILFSQESETERDEKSLEAEIKFLRELVTKLSNNSSQTIITTIREVEKPYIRWEWYQPYQMWCSAMTAGTLNVTSAQNGIGAAQYTLTSGASNSSAMTGFNSIKTF